jgi:hypothetical protein
MRFPSEAAVSYFFQAKSWLIRSAGARLATSSARITRADLEAAISEVRRLDGHLQLATDCGGPPMRIDLSFTDVGDRDLIFLQALDGLHHLGLAFTCITDAGIAHLSNLTALESLNLAFTGLTDRALKHVALLTGLRTLNLSSTLGVTDEGILELRSLNQLRHLYLVDTEVTPRCVAAIQEAVPGIKIQWNPFVLS